MRLRSNFSRLLVPVVMTIIASCGAGRVSAEDYGPAHVILLTNSTARYFMDFDPPPPPDGRVLVAGDDQGTVFAFVLGTDTRDANDQLDVLRVVGDVEGCSLEGITCCDENAHIWVLDSEFQKERFWLRLGEKCEPVEEGAEPGVAFTPVDPEIWQDLTELGVTQPLMTLPDANYERRVLIAPWWQPGELSLPGYSELKSLSPIILVNHVNPNTNPPGPAAPSGGCITKTGCPATTNPPTDSSRCYADQHASGTRHTERHHWYIKDGITSFWCESVQKCNCKPP